MLKYIKEIMKKLDRSNEILYYLSCCQGQIYLRCDGCNGAMTYNATGYRRDQKLNIIWFYNSILCSDCRRNGKK